MNSPVDIVLEIISRIAVDGVPSLFRRNLPKPVHRLRTMAWTVIIGSLAFAAHSGQIFGLYLVALVFVPLGYGHLLLRSWAYKLSLAALWSWLILAFLVWDW